MAVNTYESSDIQSALLHFIDNFRPERQEGFDKSQSKEWNSPTYSQRYQLISEVATAAAQHTIEKGGDVSNFWSAANHGVWVVDNLTLGLTDVGDDERHTDPLSSGTSGGTKTPHIR